MKKLIGLSIFITVFVLTGCTTMAPPQRTANEGEFVVTTIHNHSIFSSLGAAKADTEKRATEFCDYTGKKFKRNYSIDHGMAIGQVVESTLYFECVD